MSALVCALTVLLAAAAEDVVEPAATLSGALPDAATPRPAPDAEAPPPVPSAEGPRPAPEGPRPAPATEAPPPVPAAEPAPHARSPSAPAQVTSASGTHRFALGDEPLRWVSASLGTAVVDTDGAVAWTLPSHSIPSAAVLVGLTDAGGVCARVKVVGRASLPVRTRRRVDVSAVIGEQVFGPVHTETGRARVDIEVPPGQRDARVVAVDRLGNRREEVIDLGVPDLPRLALVADGREVAVRGTLRIVAAATDVSGAAFLDGAAIRLRAERGALVGPSCAPSGACEYVYTAPDTPGRDALAAWLDGDADAGVTTWPLRVELGPPARVRVDVPDGPHAPGEAVELRARVFDAGGNVLDAPVRFVAGDAPLEATADGDTWRARLTVPEQLGAQRQLEVVARADDATGRARVLVAAAPAESAGVSAEAFAREATVVVSGRDRFGNALEPERVVVEASGAVVEPLALAGDDGDDAGRVEPLRLRLRAERDARFVALRVHADGRALYTSEIAFEAPPEDALLVGAFATGGWSSNRAALSGPRGGLGVVLRVGVGPLELGALCGVETRLWSDRLEVPLAGGTRAVRRSVTLVSAPLLARVRWPLGALGVSAAGGASMTFAHTKARSDVSVPEAWSGIVSGGRAEAGVDWNVDAVRLVVGAAWGSARVNAGAVRGELEGLSAFARAEWWLWDVGAP